ncbi:arylsulfatase [Psychrobacter sp. H8-1]|uniref:arylsulfatase n=1 Tax=Psychrobacter sp. H8-1 TaxID=2774129 RepID=UPI00191B0E23|nr:arylsulfatase [Psychrobacter sp. H8-1]
MTAFNNKLIIGSGMMLTGMSVTHAATVADTASNTENQKPPNVLVIMADDLGFSDISPYGGEIETPNLQMLAENGVSFTDFSVTPYSAPSRAAFLTGSDPHEVGLGNLFVFNTPEQNKDPDYVGHLNDKALSIAQRLQQAGYYTVISGKWHLGTKPENAPTNWGFDDSFVYLKGDGNHYKRDNYPDGPDGDQPYRLNGELVELPDDFYSSTTFADYLMKSLNQRPDNKPFFAYLQFTAPHSPLQAPLEDIKKYDGHYQDGPRALAEQRFKNAKKLNFIPESAKQPTMVGYPSWDSFSEEDRQKEIKRMQIYAAMVDNMDANIGRVIDDLKEKGELDNTYIFFFSDNGAAGKYRETAGRWKDWVNNDHDNSLANMGNFDSYVSTGTGWAQASNMPFSLFKGYTSEGGVRSPLIASGPNIPKSKVSDKYSNLTDLAPTILDIAGVAKTTPKGKASLDGETLMPALTQPQLGAQGPYEPKVLEMNGAKMVRFGDFKALANTHRFAGLDDDAVPTQQWQLYNLAQDPGETTNIAEQYPKILDSMIANYNDYAKKVGVVEVSPTSK